MVNDKMEDTMVKVSAEDCVQVGNEIIFICREFNMICALDLDNGDIRIIGSLPEESLFAERLGSKIIYWRDELIFIPMKAKKIWRYNIKTGEWRGYERKDLGDGMTELGMFEAVLYNDEIYAIGCYYPAILRLNLLNDKVTYLEEPFKDLKVNKKKVRDCYFRTGYVQRDYMLYLATVMDNKVLALDMQSLEYKWFEVGDKGNTYSGIAWDGDKFWLAPRHSTPIVSWDGKNEVKQYKFPPEYSNRNYAFLGVTNTKDGVIFPGMNSEKTVIVKNDILSIMQGQFLFYNVINSNKLVSISKESVLKIYGEDEKTYILNIAKNTIEKYIEENVVYDDMCTKILNEDKDMSLKIYLKLI